MLGRNLLTGTLVLGLGLLVTAMGVEAQSEGESGGRRGGQGTAQPTEEQREAMKQRRAEQQQALMTELGLSEQQQKQFVALQESMQTRMQELRKTGERPTGEQMTAMRAEQQQALAKYGELRKQRGQNGERGQRGQRGQRDGGRVGQGR